jgi:solute carrier family 39 (zinc transporter), member 9
MHVMNEENGSDHSHGHGHSANGYADNGTNAHQRKQKGPQMRDTLATMVGMLLPLLAQLGGHHHH